MFNKYLIVVMIFFTGCASNQPIKPKNPTGKVLNVNPEKIDLNKLSI